MRSRSLLGRRRVWQYVAVFLLALILVGMLLPELMRTDAATLQTVRYAATAARIRITGVILRDETVLGCDDVGPVRFLCEEGQAVAAGDAVARVYQDDTAGEKRARAAEINAEIARLSAALDAVQWQADYVRAYRDVMSAVSAGTPAAAGAATAQLQNALAAHGAEASEDAYLARIGELEEEFARLVQNAPNVSTVTAQTGGCFYRENDGYEARLGTRSADTLTAGTLRAMLETTEPTDKAVGKVVGQGTWYFAAPAAPATAALFAVGETYALNFENYGDVEMTLARVAPDEGEGALLVFCAAAAPANFGAARRRTVSVQPARDEGLTCAGAALYREGEETVVYVWQDGVACRRRVQVLPATDGALLLMPAPGEAQPLTAGERVILTARRLYDGKAVRVNGNG